jgi:hypothetical protein
MKAKQDTTLFRVLTGSRMYGTATETSDFDYKAVCLPSFDDLLLNVKVTNRKEKPAGTSQDAKMKAGETETEYVPLQIFFDDYFNGQTYALEIAFAVVQGNFEIDHSGFMPVNELTLEREYLKSIFTDLATKFITRNVQKMVGYAVAQSKIYGLKTERYTSLKAVSGLLTDYLAFSGSAENSDVLRDQQGLYAGLLTIPHTKEAMIPNANGGSALAPAFEVCGKQYPLTNKITTILKSVDGTLKNYGERVKEYEGEQVDWKALSHAIRITEQILELCGTGKLTFPRPNAQFLLDVKSGKLTLDEATNYLNDAFSKVDDAIATSILQEKTPELTAKFREWKVEVLSNLYGI